MLDDAAIDQVLNKTVEFLDYPSVVGFEQPFLSHLATSFEALGCKIDREGKILAVHKGPARSEIFSCHIDRHGLVATGDREYEYAAYVTRLREYGEEAEPTCRMLKKIRGRFLKEPVFAYDPATGERLAQGTIARAYFCGHRVNLVFRISGFKSQPIGTPVSFCRPCQTVGESFTGQLDNVISAAVVHELFALGFSGRALFTSEEEIGKSWSLALDYLDRRKLRPRELLVLDTSPFPDPAAIDEGRIVLRNRDANGIFNPALVSRLRGICGQQGIPYQMKDDWIARANAERVRRGKKPTGLGSTELGRLVSGSDGVVNGATVQIPTFGYHSNQETTSRRSIGQLLRLLTTLLEL